MKCNSVAARNLLFLAALCTSVGCNTGNVQVGNAGSPAAVPKVQPTAMAPAPIVTQPNSSDSQPVTNLQSKIYFEEVEITAGIPDVITAIDFASEGASSTTPYGVPLKSPVGFKESANFFPSVNEVDFLLENSLFSNSLGQANLDTFSTKSLFDFPRATGALSMDSSRTEVSWIDLAGTVSITNLGPSIKTQTVDLAGDTGVSAHLSPSGNRLLVRTASGGARTFSKDNQGAWNLELALAQVEAASFSPDESQLAYVSDHSLFVVKTGSAQAQAIQITTLESSLVYDFSWFASDAVSYWTRLNSGNAEIRIANLSDHHEHTVTQVKVPSAVTDGVVCPAWSGTTLYFSALTHFADKSDERFAIEKVELGSDGKAQAAALFAAPPASDEGLICPKSQKGA